MKFALTVLSNEVIRGVRRAAQGHAGTWIHA